jgi:ABC-type sugar transport system ATPase subunit
MINDRDATLFPPEERNLGVVYQDYALFPHLTVYGNIVFGMRLRGRGRGECRKAAHEMARFLEIDHLLDRRPGRLSGGERQRVALARALVLRPHMLLLDEPLSALDRSTRDRLRRELKRIHVKLGISILHITHDLSEAFYLADRLVVMKDGEVLQEGVPEEILRRPAERFVAELVGIENFIPARIAKGELLLPEDMGGEVCSSSAGGSEKECESVFVTVPGWAVEICPSEQEDSYLWRGMMRIMNLSKANGAVEVELAHGSGVRLNCRLSRREASRLPVSLDRGTEVETGLLKEGIHWVPAVGKGKAPSHDPLAGPPPKKAGSTTG